MLPNKKGYNSWYKFWHAVNGKEKTPKLSSGESVELKLAITNSSKIYILWEKYKHSN